LRSFLLSATLGKYLDGSQMGTYNAVIILFFLAASAAAQQPSPSLFKVEGTVINSSTGKPLSRALIQVSGCAQLSGNEGDFSCDGISKGMTQISVSKPGFFVPGATDSRSYSSLEVGPDTGKVLLKLAPEAVIFGHVTGRDGEPLEGAVIQVFGYVSRNGRRQLESRGGSPRTDEDGDFRVGGLPAGRYYVAVKAGNSLRGMLSAQDVRTRQAYPALVYYPETGDLASATALEVSPGQRVEVSFSLSLVPAFKLAGTVATASECKQVGTPTIVGAMDEWLFSADQFDRQAGTFEFRSVPAGSYTLRVSGMDQQNHPIHSDRVITVSQPVTNLKLVLKPSPIISVRIRAEFNQQRPPGSCTYSAHTATGVELRHSDCSEFPAAHVEMIPAGPARSSFTATPIPSADPSALELNGVPPGKYRVHAAPTPYRGGYVRSLRSGAVDLLRDELIVPEEGSIDPIEVVMRDDSAAVTVRVHGEKVEPATVLLFSEGGALEPRILGRTDSEFQANGLAPGTYKLLAFADLQGLDYAEPEVLAHYLDRAASVTVSANNNVSVIVEVIHIGE
jgi:hypothetical protein